jgi:tRNA pseudouridine55 synthase
LILLGSATRLSEYFLALDKTYGATARLGVETSTHDLQGDVVRRDPGWSEVEEAGVEEALRALSGTIRQVPPRYSSKKIGGVAAHRRVRRGEDVVLDPAEVQVHQIVLEEFSPPEVRFQVRCSSGTYVRALARDLGRGLGVGAHLTALVREAIGSFTRDSAISLDDLSDPEEVERHLVAPALALSHLPSVALPRVDANRVRQGQLLSVTDTGLPEGEPIRILVDGDLLAIGELSGNRLRPRKVLSHG